MKLFLLISASFLSPAVLFYFIYLFLSLSLFNFIHCLPLPRQFSKACIFIFVRKVMRVVIAKVTISASCLAAAKKKKNKIKRKFAKKKNSNKSGTKSMPQNGCNKHAAQKPGPSHEWQSENGSAKAEAKCAEISKTENEKIPKTGNGAEIFAKRKNAIFPTAKRF